MRSVLGRPARCPAVGLDPDASPPSDSSEVSRLHGDAIFSYTVSRSILALNPDPSPPSDFSKVSRLHEGDNFSNMLGNRASRPSIHPSGV